jgi:hypothetical protein
MFLILNFSENKNNLGEVNVINLSKPNRNYRVIKSPCVEFYLSGRANVLFCNKRKRVEKYLESERAYFQYF